LNARKLIGGTRIDQAAPGVFIRYHYDAMRAQNLGRLGHKPDAAECDHIAVEILRPARKLQAIAHRIGEFLNLGFLVVMRQDDGLAVALEFEDLFGKSRGTDHR
jgi:hypothetical protein